MRSHFLFFYKKYRVVVKTAFKNSHSVLRKVEKRTELGRIPTKPAFPIVRVGSLIPEP